MILQYGAQMYFSNIDSVAFTVLSFDVKWYSIAYIVGILSCVLYAKIFLKSKQSITDDLIFWGVIGVILGGRMGYVLFYNFSYYLDHPIKIFSIWEGGMSFHGAFIGSIISMKIISIKRNIPFWHFADVLACSVPIGIFFGRIANFVNGELYGNITDKPWGVVFSHVDVFPRHPSQLYEALGEGLLLFVMANFLLFFTKSIKIHGRISSISIMTYSIIRIVVENFRTPDAHIGYLALNFTLGQWLSLPLFALGLIVFADSCKAKNSYKSYRTY